MLCKLPKPLEIGCLRRPRREKISWSRLRRRRDFFGLAVMASTTAHTAFASSQDESAEGLEVTEPTIYVSGFFGQITDNSHPDIFFRPWEVDFLDSYMVGAAIGFERQTPWSSVDIGAEAQLVKWFGDQTHWELNAMPIIGRYRFNGVAGPLRSLAFGLGFSYASEIPRYELESDGESNRFMIYWSAEAEFGKPDAEFAPFIKVHHRSNAFGLIEEEAGSNAIALGLRRRF